MSLIFSPSPIPEPTTNLSKDPEEANEHGEEKAQMVDYNLNVDCVSDPVMDNWSGTGADLSICQVVAKGGWDAAAVGVVSVAARGWNAVAPNPAAT